MSTYASLVLLLLAAVGSFSFAAIEQAIKNPVVIAGLRIYKCQALIAGLYESQSRLWIENIHQLFFKHLDVCIEHSDHTNAYQWYMQNLRPTGYSVDS